MNLALLAAAATGVQVGAAIAASRLVIAEVPPLTLALLRYAIGLLCLLPFAYRPFRAAAQHWQASGATKTIAQDLLVLAALGIGQFAILIALANWALQYLAAAQAALIFGLFPLITLLLAAAFGQERIHARLLSGVLLSIAGVAASLVPKLWSGANGASGAHWWGEAAVLASAVIGALCSVLYRPYLRRYPTVPVSAFAMAASVLFLALLALTESWPKRVAALDWRTWVVVAFIGMSSGVGYFAWLYALKHETATRVTVFLALNPLTAALLGAAYLGEPLGGWSIAAWLGVAGGLWLATREQPTRCG